jgi:hypothetical protein
MSQLIRLQRVLEGLAVSLICLALAGCPTAEQAKPRTPPQQPGPVATKTPAANPSPDKEAQGESTSVAEPAAQPETELAPIVPQTKTIRDLGPPLVDNLATLKRLDPDFPVWLDPQNKQVVFLGEVCGGKDPLEFFVTYRDRAYESIVTSDVQPWIVHTGLLALGAEAGHPAQFQPEFAPPTGTEVAIEVRWKDAQGQTHSSPAQDWVRNVETKKALDTNWVFAGSLFVTDDETHKKIYMGNGGDFICLTNLPTAVLDLPIHSTKTWELRMFEAFVEHLPPAGTPVTLLLKPKLEPKP